MIRGLTTPAYAGMTATDAVSRAFIRSRKQKRPVGPFCDTLQKRNFLSGS